jgi:hypothetical protein
MDTYLSPLHFLPEGTNLKDINAKQFLLAKKKLLAEIELSPDKTIVLNKTVCTRNDILNLFDDLSRNEEQLQYHLYIFGNATLLEFLENRFVDITSVSLTDELKKDRGFINFISPYIEKVYTPLFVNGIKQCKIADINLLMANSFLMNYADRDKSYKAVRNLINRYIEQIIIYTQKINEHIQTSLSHFTNPFASPGYKIKDLKPYYNPALIAVLNVLPALFDDIRTEYCRALGSMAIGLNRSNRTIGLTSSYPLLALLIIKNLRNLQCSGYMHQWVEDTYLILARNADPFARVKELYAILKDFVKGAIRIIKE